MVPEGVVTSFLDGEDPSASICLSYAPDDHPPARPLFFAPPGFHCEVSGEEALIARHTASLKSNKFSCCCTRCDYPRRIWYANRSRRPLRCTRCVYFSSHLVREIALQPLPACQVRRIFSYLVRETPLQALCRCPCRCLLHKTGRLMRESACSVLAAFALRHSPATCRRGACRSRAGSWRILRSSPAAPGPGRGRACRGRQSGPHP